MKNPPHNIAASVRQRLLNLSKASSVDYNQLLIRYAIERLLYRLSRSRHRENFVLKGAMLFVIWEGSPHRPTQDVDLLGFGDRSPDCIAGVFRELCETAVEDDGIIFAAKTVQAEEIRTTDEHGGVRVRSGRRGWPLVLQRWAVVHPSPGLHFHPSEVAAPRDSSHT